MEIKSYQQASDLWLTFKERMTTFVKSKVVSQELAEEINAQILQKLLNSCCSGKEIMNVSSWMYRIAYNTLIDELKKQKKHDDLDSELALEEPSPAYKKLSEFIEPLIGFLPEKYAIPLIMADIEGMKQEDIAKQLGLSTSGTKSRIQRARKLLKEEINTCFYLDPDNPKNPDGFQLKETCIPLQKLVKKEI